MKVINGLQEAVLVGLTKLTEIEMLVLSPGEAMDVEFGSADEEITIGKDLQLEQRLGPIVALAL